jgi:hypothetical protein
MIESTPLFFPKEKGKSSMMCLSQRTCIEEDKQLCEEAQTGLLFFLGKLRKEIKRQPTESISPFPAFTRSGPSGYPPGTGMYTHDLYFFHAGGSVAGAVVESAATASGNHIEMNFPTTTQQPTCRSPDHISTPTPSALGLEQRLVRWEHVRGAVAWASALPDFTMQHRNTANGASERNGCGRRVHSYDTEER